MRCDWVPSNNQLYIDYHDKEWGVKVKDDRTLFEFLILEGAQAGLSWSTILKKRVNYRKAFDNFDHKKVMQYNEDKYNELLNNAGIVRNRLKIRSAINNAKVFNEIIKEFGSFNSYLKTFQKERIINHFKKLEDIPAKTELSDKISIDLKKRGMNFVGSTIIYAFLQAVGIVNDHQTKCFRHKKQ